MTKEELRDKYLSYKDKIKKEDDAFTLLSLQHFKKTTSIKRKILRVENMLRDVLKNEVQSAIAYHSKQ